MQGVLHTALLDAGYFPHFHIQDTVFTLLGSPEEDQDNPSLRDGSEEEMR